MGTDLNEHLCISGLCQGLTVRVVLTGTMATPALALVLPGALPVPAGWGHLYFKDGFQSAAATTPQLADTGFSQQKCRSAGAVHNKGSGNGSLHKAFVLL